MQTDWRSPVKRNEEDGASDIHREAEKAVQFEAQEAQGDLAHVYKYMKGQCEESDSSQQCALIGQETN